MKETSIAVTSVGIRFLLSHEEDGRSGSLFSFLVRKKREEFWALKDISFEAKKGEIFGIIGSNGAGKSTLLKIIAGIYPSTEGEVRSAGHIASLIELGAAFNPELTGAENIYLTGSVYRIPRKVIRQNFDKIVDFSGIRKFIDIPIKNYSSGMFIRLAFSIVIFFQPDIVLIDEVFSVGDEVFQQKSFEKVMSFKEKGATIVLVSHDLNLINQLCNRVLVLSGGRTSFLGPAEDAVNHYHKLITSGEGLESRPRPKAAAPADPRRWGNKKIEITSVRFVDEKGNIKPSFRPGDYFETQISYVSHAEDLEAVFGVAVCTVYKMLIYGPNTIDKDMSKKIRRKGLVRFIIPSLPLFEGDYLFSASVYDPTLSLAYDHHDMMYHFRVSGKPDTEFGCVRIQSKWEHESA